MVLPVIVAVDAVAEARARIVAALRQAIASGRRASIALSGGETPWRMLARFKPADLDWTLVDVFQVDERIVPRDHADRNLRRLREVLTVPAVIHPMPVEASDLDRAAAEYAASLPAAFDIVQLGLGTDGHTASLVPHDPVLDVVADIGITAPYPFSSGPSASKQDVNAQHEAGHGDIGGRAPSGAEKELGHRRMTLTFPTINRALSILWLVTGTGKRDVLAALLEGKADIPANRVGRNRAIVVADRDAAG